MTREERFSFRPGRLVVEFSAPAEGPVVISRVGPDGSQLEPATRQPLAEVFVAGDAHLGQVVRYSDSAIGARLRHLRHQIETDDGEHRIEVVQSDPVTGLEVTTVLLAAPDVAAMRAYTEIRNRGDEDVVLEAVATLGVPVPMGVGESPRDLDLISGQSEQVSEFRWSRRELFGPDGLPDRTLDPYRQTGFGVLAATSTSTWTTGADLPTGVVVNRVTGRGLGWQIEHNGAWRSEIVNHRDGADAAALVLLGPEDLHHAWAERLQPGDVFTTVPASIAVSDAGFDGVLAEMTRHRRWLRRHRGTDPDHLLVYNDYMNTLVGDPTTEKLLPLIETAAAAGAEGFCIDAGWYDDTDEGHWWPSVGEWLPSVRRFPDGGLARVTAEIRRRGMIPGLWLEPEVIGVDSPAATSLPEEAFLRRRGRRIQERSRYFLDLRHPAARAHLDATVDRLVGELGVGFFKLDYNVTPGVGTDQDAYSVGSGLLALNRAHLGWLAGVRERHPQVVIENCSSGAMRADFGMLEVLDFQSTSDQIEFTLYPPIAVGAPVQLLPEQAGNWAYAQSSMTEEEIAFTMITGLAGRLYLSGFWQQMSPDQLGLVTDAVAQFKQLRGDIARSVPGWPLGLPTWSSPHLALTLTAPDRTLLYVWHRGGDSAIELPGLGAADLVERYPRRLSPWSVSDTASGVAVRPGVEGPSARLYDIG